MKIKRVLLNNRKKVFLIETQKEKFEFPFSKLKLKPSKSSFINKVYVDKELNQEAITYTLSSGEEDSIHLDNILEYNKDSDAMRKIFLYKLTMQSQRLIKQRKISIREISRTLKTSPTQVYRLLDQTFYGKTIDQMLRLLDLFDCSIDITFHKKAA